ncbi:MAG: hypothetical protein ACXABY_28980 [Candidatus Thorarchaeota archaeon]|jgi:hypothetical protein
MEIVTRCKYHHEVKIHMDMMSTLWTVTPCHRCLEDARQQGIDFFVNDLSKIARRLVAERQERGL